MDLADEVLLEKAGVHRWILLTKDRRIRRRPVELEALKRARVRALFFAAGDMTSAQMISSFRAALQRIQRLVKREKPPFLQRITPSGQLEKL
jgi:rRNA-processing protein FCF1